MSCACQNRRGQKSYLFCVLCRSGKDYLNVLQVNVVGPFLVTVHFLPLLRKKQTRAVVHTSSICGSISGARQGMFGGKIVAYNSSKVRHHALSLQKRCVAETHVINVHQTHMYLWC